LSASGAGAHAKLSLPEAHWFTLGATTAGTVTVPGLCALTRATMAA
jgi:hypothetical protein